MSNVRAKFYVETVTRQGGASGGIVGGSVVLKAVNGDAADNASWSKYTPNGKIEMTITNPAALDALEPGKSFFVDFTPAEPPPT